MNIDKIAGRPCSTELARQGKAKGKSSFSGVLDKCIDTLDSRQGATEAAGAITEAVLVAGPETSKIQGAVLQQASKVVDLLEKYAGALDNPQTTLRSIEPMVARLQQELNGLDVKSVRGLGQDDELEKIVNRIAVTAAVEAFKFQRGDYVA